MVELRNDGFMFRFGLGVYLFVQVGVVSAFVLGLISFLSFSFMVFLIWGFVGLFVFLVF